MNRIFSFFLIFLFSFFSLSTFAQDEESILEEIKDTINSIINDEENKEVIEIENSNVFNLSKISCDNDSHDLDSYTDEQLDLIIEKCEKEIEADKKLLEKKEDEADDINDEISALDYQIAISNNYINSKHAEANRLNRDIEKNRETMISLEERLQEIKKSLVTLLRKRNEMDNFSPIEAILSSKTLSGFFIDNDSISFIENEITFKYDELNFTQEELEIISANLAERESLERSLAYQEELEKKTIEVTKDYREILLEKVETEKEVYEISIQEKESLKQEILKKKFRTVGGEEIEFGDALNLIRPYESQLGVDTAFILAILFQESGFNGVIGGNIGQCIYNNYNAYGTRNGDKIMSSSQIPSYLKIMEGLSLNPEDTKISCPIPSDGAYGGAMGPAQFMPVTWLSVRDKAAKILGVPSESLSPFANQDSFIASGVYLSQQYYSSSCQNYANEYSHISPEKLLSERCAASRYYAGGAWWKFRFQYGESVIQRAERFREDIKILDL